MTPRHLPNANVAQSELFVQTTAIPAATLVPQHATHLATPTATLTATPTPAAHKTPVEIATRAAMIPAALPP